MELTQFKQQLFRYGKEQEFEEMELSFESTDKFSCQIHKGELDQYDTSFESGVSFRGLFNGKMGYAYTEKLDNQSILFLVENAKENAFIIEDEDEEAIFEGSQSYEKLSFHSDELANVTIQEKVDLLLKVESLIRESDPRVIGTNYCMLQTGEQKRVLANSKGLSLSEKSNYLMMYIAVMVKDGEDVKTGQYTKLTRDFSALNAQEISREAVNEALSFIAGKSIASKTYPVVLRRDAAASLLHVYSTIFSSEDVQKGLSRLKGKEGERIGVSTLQLVDNPLLEEGFASRTFDSEGVASTKRYVVENGVLKSLFYNTKTAKKEGKQSTGHAYKSSYKGTLTVAPSNFYIEATDTSYEQIIESVSEGVLITHLSGLHSGTNPISGDFSVAAKGHYIKGGKVVSSVTQMTIAGNFYELLNSIDLIGSDIDFAMDYGGGYVGSPTLKINRLAVTAE
ncbi:TldD/PmbA family protein [Bacillus sp. CGMCC 1.16541]|uniref:TldD/PmbA family protein n=1 Tax=Bacillus sp. CGMCC 1.16541 TaxID=2185143 RepID=UPI000D72AFC1|nr:TldD/PmbA family protein [Bacillus sp. CGMCC 1.16541]